MPEKSLKTHHQVSPTFSTTTQRIMLAGIVSSALAVVFGAFGAHLLKQVLSGYGMQIYKTAVSYHMWHSFALIAIGLTLQIMCSSKLLEISAWLMFSGIILFSGSLYLLSLTGIHWLGMITPFGGLCFLIAWSLFAIAVYKIPTTDFKSID